MLVSVTHRCTEVGALVPGPGDDRVDQGLADAVAAGLRADEHGDELDHARLLLEPPASPAGSDALSSGMKAKNEPSRVARRCQTARRRRLPWRRSSRRRPARPAGPGAGCPASPASRPASSRAPGPCPMVASAASARQPFSAARVSPAVVHAQPALGGHPDHDLVGRPGLARDEGVAALGAQVPRASSSRSASVASSMTAGPSTVTYLYGGRSSWAHRLNRPAAAMARALRVSGRCSRSRAARLVGVPDRGGQRPPAVGARPR